MFLKLAIAGAVALGYLVGSVVYVHAQSAIPDPDSMTIESVRAYSGVINSGDMLVVVEYRIDYNTLPSLAATDAFIGRFLVAGSEVNNAEIVSFNNLGYGLGVFSFYFTNNQRETAGIEFQNPNAENYQVVLQGKPSAFADPPRVQTGSITYRDATSTAQLLLSDISSLANRLENDPGWLANNLDLISFTTGQEALTATGEAYFGQAIPNLQLMIPDLFGSSRTVPEVNERQFGTSEQERLKGLWDTSPFNDGFEEATNLIGLGKVWVLGLIGAGLVIFGSFWANRLSGSPEFGMLTILFTWPLVTAAGLGTMTAVFFVTALGVLGLMFSLFLRRAG